MRQRRADPEHARLDLTGQQILGGLRAAPHRHMDHVELERRGHVLGGEMLLAAQPGGHVVQLAGIGPHIGDERGEVAERRVLVGQHHDRAFGQQADRLEVAQRLEVDAPVGQ